MASTSSINLTWKTWHPQTL